MSIRQKLMLSPLAAALGFVVIGAISAWSAFSSLDRLSLLGSKGLTPVASLQAVQSSIDEMRYRMVGYLAGQSPAKQNSEQALKAVEVASAEWNKSRTLIQGQDAELDALIQKLDSSLPKLQSFSEKLIAAYKTNQRDEVQSLIEDEWPWLNANLVKPLGSVSRVLAEKANQTVSEAEKETKAILILLAIAGCISMIGVLLVSLQVSRKLNSDVENLANTAAKVASGDLAVRVEPMNDVELNQIASAISVMTESFRAIVSEISLVVQSAEKGELGLRIDLSGKQGFSRDIGQALNQLLSLTDGSLREISRVSSALANGDLTQKVQTQYPGTFGETAAAVNQTVTSLNQLVDEVHGFVDAAAQGDFERLLETNGKAGYGRTLVDLLNKLSLTANEALGDISRVSQALAQGDLSQSIDKQYPGLFGQTADGINETAKNLRGLVSNVVEAVNTIDTASQEISSGNRDLSVRTEEQASNLDQTATRMEQFTGMVQRNTDSAKEASALAKEASEIAVSGGGVVKATVETMAQIHESSKKIGDIISVIDGIAFQTNILALNAAVEAARAGEQGKGFAVVATEVRSLAQRSAQAAKEITGLISDSVSKVERGTHQAEEAGRTMDSIVESVAKVTAVVASISEASTEQLQGIQQVSQAITQMDEATQQNAALVEQAAAAAESLAEQADDLKRHTDAFVL